jgi:hypothetical protein
MHIEFHIPLTFDFKPEGYGRYHIASGDTGEFWFGLIFTALCLWNLWSGLRPNGEFSGRGYVVDRDDFLYWPIAAATAIAALVGLYMVVDAAFDGSTL